MLLEQNIVTSFMELVPLSTLVVSISMYIKLCYLTLKAPRKKCI